LGHVLEHVIDPVGLLKQAKGWLNPEGRIFCAVPNANSIHRQAAVIMGLLESEASLNESDLQHGHRRVFSPQELKSTFIEAGLLIQLFGGYWLKPLSNQQIQSNWTQSMIDAFMILGERYPEISGEIYVVAA
jgi:2-polyprenyl-3-methyl-5-hydroxy-6-metoxy-1,4-benzoquinol methylase